MKTRLVNLWDRVSGGFWFVPTMLVVSAAVLGILLPIWDVTSRDRWSDSRWLATTADGARAVLSVTAGSMITVASVVFSVTMVTISIAASQFGSRVLRWRMHDRPTQIALGAFLGTCVYCFLVLRTIQKTDEVTTVPHLSVAFAIVLSIISTFVLIYFIHDVAEAVQSPHIVARLAADLNDAIERLHPDEFDGPESGERAGVAAPKPEPDHIVEADCEGYLQAIDDDSLLHAACRDELLIWVCVRPGDFVTLGEPVAKLWGRVDEAAPIDKRINAALILGDMRTPREDVNCAVHELAQLTVRALSPGINDPFTAVNGIDRLTGSLSRLARRRVPTRHRTDKDGTLRVGIEQTAFPETLAAAFNQIRQHAESMPPVGVRLLEGLATIARNTRRESDRDAVRQQATMVLDVFSRAGHLDRDLQSLRRQFERVQTILNRPTASGSDKRNEAAADSGTTPSKNQARNEDASAPPAEGEVNG